MKHAAVVAVDEDYATTLADGTIVRPRWIVAADGHYSPVRHMLTGSARELGTWHAFRQYFTGVDDRRLWVLFEEDFLPGYAWVFPVGDGRANVGFGVLRDQHDGAAGKTLAAQWRSLTDRPSVRRALGPDAQPDGPMRAWPIPATYDRARLAHGRALFVGDAANVVDPMTGEGIAQALETGALAVRAIAGSPDDPDVVAARYRSRRRPCARRRPPLRGVAATHPARTRSAPGPRSPPPRSHPWTRRNFARWMFEDYPRALVFTPRRWRKGALAPGGAYPDALV